jgi:hypothetical protein
VDRQALQHLLAVAVDDCQQIVEVVRESAGETADGLEPLRVSQLFAEVVYFRLCAGSTHALVRLDQRASHG